MAKPYVKGLGRKVAAGAFGLAVAGSAFAGPVTWPTLDLQGVEGGIVAVGAVLMAASGVMWGVRKILSLI